MDILDESIDLFRANSLFRNFEIKGPADRVSPQSGIHQSRVSIDSLELCSCSSI